MGAAMDSCAGVDPIEADVDATSALSGRFSVFMLGVCQAACALWKDLARRLLPLLFSRKVKRKGAPMTSRGSVQGRSCSSPIIMMYTQQCRFTPLMGCRFCSRHLSCTQTCRCIFKCPRVADTLDVHLGNMENRMSWGMIIAQSHETFPSSLAYSCQETCVAYKMTPWAACPRDLCFTVARCRTRVIFEASA